MPELTTVDALAQLSFLIQETVERRAIEQDSSLIQTRLLGILRDRKPTINELAALLGLDKSSVSGLVDRAAKRGWVRRVPSMVDRRSVRVALTDAGREVVEHVSAGFAQDVEQLLAPLDGAQRDELTDGLTRVLMAHAERHGVDLFANLAR